MLGTTAVMSVVNYAYAMLAGRLLDPGDFGLLAFAQTLLLVATTVLQSGIPWSLTRVVVSSDPSRRSRLASGSAFANVVLALVIDMAIIVLFVGGPLRHGLESGTMALIVVVTLPVMAMLAVARAVILGIEDVSAYAALLIIEVVTKALLGLTLIIAGVRAIGAVSGFLFGALAAAVVGVIHLVRCRGFRISRAMELPSLPETAPMFGALLGLALLVNMDLLAVKLLAGEERAITGYYQAATILASGPYFLVSAGLVTILFAQLAGQSAIRDTSTAVGKTLSAAAVIFIPLNLVLISLPGPALALLFDEGYLPGRSMLRWLALGTIGTMVVSILGAAFEAIGDAGTVARVLLAIVALETAGLALAVPAHGAEGAAIVFVAASFTSGAALGAIYLRRSGPGIVSEARSWGARFGTTVIIGLAAGFASWGLTHMALLSVAITGIGYVWAAGLLRTWQGPASFIVGGMSPNEGHPCAEEGGRRANPASRL